MSIEKWVDDFARHVAAQTDAIFRGDARTGNKHAKLYGAAFEKLRSKGEAGRAALAALFTHPRMDVRVAAAAHLLRYRTAEAKAVLQEVAKGEGLAAFEASESLKRWEEGAWTLDPDENGCRSSTEVSLGPLVEAFAHHTAAQTDAIFRGDARTGNKHANKRVAAFKKLCAHGDAGRDALAALFKHPRMDVRAMAAAYLLRHRTAEAKAVLVELSKGEGLAAFGASEALKRWEEGVWALDPSEAAKPAPEASPANAEVLKRRTMKKAQLKELSIEQLIEMTRTASAERWRAINAGKPKDGNRMFDLLVAIRRELRTRGLEAQRRLMGLLDAPEPGTRCWAAVSVLEFAPDEGERVLAELAKLPDSLVGFSAEMTLEQWKAGTFKPL